MEYYLIANIISWYQTYRNLLKIVKLKKNYYSNMRYYHNMFSTQLIVRFFTTYFKKYWVLFILF